MTKIHSVLFPNYALAVSSEKRTLFHLPLVRGPFAAGEALRLHALPYTAPGKIGVITDAREVRLLAELDVDLAKLYTESRSIYLASWDKLYPKLTSAGDPLVWRVEFRYGEDPDPPEWSLAV